MNEKSQTTRRNGLHCALDKCIGPPNGPMPECHAGCSFTVSALPAAYIPDPAEEAYYASPEGLRASARILREEAARMVQRAEDMERRANAGR